MRSQCLFQPHHGVDHLLVDFRPAFLGVAITARENGPGDAADAATLDIVPHKLAAENLFYFLPVSFKGLEDSLVFIGTLAPKVDAQLRFCCVLGYGVDV